jgi:adenylate kinase
VKSRRHSPGLVSRIGITGSPGTGKKSVARALSKLLGYEMISLNDLAVSQRLGRWASFGQDKEFVIDPQKLSVRKIEAEKRIIVGHLLPYMLKRSKLDFVAILRCSPQVLNRRYRLRNYSERKIDQNLLAESLDIVSYEALRTFGKEKVSEFDTSHTSPKSVAKAIVDTIEGKRRRQYGNVAWSTTHAFRRKPCLAQLSTTGEHMRVKKKDSTKKVISLQREF